jgi:hypothetical protein
MHGTSLMPVVLGTLLVLSSGLAHASPAPSASSQTPAPGVQQARTFVGNVSGLQNIDAKFVAVVGPNGNAVAYLSSNDQAWNQQYSKWYVGQASGGRLTARASDGTELTGTLQGNTVTGTVAGGQWTGTLTSSGLAGLYRARVSDDEVDLTIVAPDGSWVGSAWSPTTRTLLRTWTSGTGVAQQLPGGAVSVRPDPQSPAVTLDPVVPDEGGSFPNSPFD